MEFINALTVLALVVASFALIVAVPVPVLYAQVRTAAAPTV